jgi:hypothetical protein
MYAGTKRYLLETKSFVGPSSISISLKDLPLNRRIRGIDLRVDVSIVQPGTATAYDGRVLRRLVKQVKIGKRVLTSSTHLNVLAWHMRGVTPQLPADLPATASTTFRRTIALWIPYSDLQSAEGHDTATRGEFFSDEPLIIDLESPAAIMATNTPTVTGTVRAVAVHEPAEYGIVPSLTEIGLLDWTGQHIVLDGERTYTHLHLFNEDGSVIVCGTEVTGMQVSVDGEALDNTFMRPRDLGQLWNWQTSQGSAYQALSATVPVPGEELTTETAYTGAAADTVNMEWIPVVSHGSNYKLSKCLHVQKQLVIDLQGSKTSFRVGWRAIVPRSESQALKAARRIGVVNPESSRVEVKTMSKSPATNPRLARILPLRFHAPDGSPRGAK